MRIVQGFSQGRHQCCGLGEGRTDWLDVLGEVAALDELGDDVAPPVLRGADIEDRDDVRVVQAGQDAGLGQVRLDIFGRRSALLVRHLDGDGAMQLLIVGQIDPPEPACTQEPLDPIATDLLRQFGCSRIRTAHFRGRRRERTGWDFWLAHGQDTFVPQSPSVERTTAGEPSQAPKGGFLAWTTTNRCPGRRHERGRASISK